MKKNSCLINIGRGNAIEEKDLLNHLKKNKNFYAYLDVFKNEPLKSSSQFWRLPNVTITPHVAGVTAIEPSVKYMYSKYRKLRKKEKVKQSREQERDGKNIYHYFLHLIRFLLLFTMFY